jgi:hypothetical protein
MDRSVTEIEMRMVNYIRAHLQILNHPSGNMPKFGWFYLRDPYYVEKVPKEKQNLFVSEGETESEKLKMLKNDIHDSEFPGIFNTLLCLTI